MRVAFISGCAVLLLSAYLHWSAFGGISVDDAFITFRYAANWAAGLGPVYNSGERVEGYSDFLWLAVLALCHRFVRDVDHPAQLLGVAAAISSLALALWSLRRVYGIREGAPQLFTASAIASSGYVAAWAVSGLESALYGLLLLALWTAFACEHETPASEARLTTALSVAIGLARPEGQLVALAFALAHLLAARAAGQRMTSRATLLSPLLVLGALLAYNTWRFTFYGPFLLPNCVRAKVGLTSAQVLRGAGYVAEHFLDPYLPLLASMFLFPRARRFGASWLGVALIAGYLLFIALAGGDWSEGRFFAPLIPLGAVLSTASLASFPRFARHTLSGRARTTAWAIASLFVVYAALRTGDREYAFRRLFADNDLERVRLGRWLRTSAPKDSVLAVTAAGQLPYYSGLYTHDMLGLNDAHIAGIDARKLGQGLAGHEKYDIHYSIERISPDVIVGAEVIPGMRRYLANRGGYVLMSLPNEEVLLRKGQISPSAVNALLQGLR